MYHMLLFDIRNYISSRIPDPPVQRHRQGSGAKHKNVKSSSLSARQRPRAQTSTSAEGEHIMVDAIFSAHSDGVMVILRKSSP